ncbi:Uncharacterized protein FWK35_00031465, partial [Aphis craccivora]
MSVNCLKYMLWCIQNANINIQSKFHGSTMFSFRVTPKTKIDYVFKTTGKFLTHIIIFENRSTLSQIRLEGGFLIRHFAFHRFTCAYTNNSNKINYRILTNQ